MIEKAITVLIVLAVALFVVWVAVSAIADGHGTSACLGYGYAEARTIWQAPFTYTTYCIRFENMREVVVPLSQLEDRGR